MTFKVYTHVDMDGYTPFTLPVAVAKAEETQFGTVKEALIKRYADIFPGGTAPDYNECCFWNQDGCPIADSSPLAIFAWEHNDFFLRALPGGSEGASALASSQKKRGELSYYYAHNRKPLGLVSKPQATGVPNAATASSAVPRTPIKAPEPGVPRWNTKQSPFGTDINAYETITTYTWEDHNDTTVKVLVPLDGVGKLNASQVRSSFASRAFELLIEGYQGKRLRFACYKTHGEMKPEECRHVVRANRVNLIITKGKEKDIWFDLFKKRAIGDDDDP